MTAANAPNGYAFANATVDNAAAEPAPPARTIFPTAFSTIGTTYALDGSARQSLVVIPAQFRSGPTGNPGFGQVREYTDADWLVTYAPASVTDFTGPQFSALTATAQGANTVVVADVDDAAGVARVLVQVLRNGHYSRIELVRQTGTPGRWAGTVPDTDVTPVQEATFFAIDANGNTASANNKGTRLHPASRGRVRSRLAAVLAGHAERERLVPDAANRRDEWHGLPPPDRRERHPAGVGDGDGRQPHGVRLRSGRPDRERRAGFRRYGRPAAWNRARHHRRRERSGGGPRRLPLPTATDNVDPAPVVTCTPAPGTTFPAGRTTVSCIATDRAGRTSSALPVATFAVVVDATPPVVTPVVTGTRGLNGWYTGDVTVAFTTADAESPVASTGCATVTVSADTSGTTFTCTATSLGGSQSAAVTVKRDATAPVVTCPVNASYTLGQTGATITASVTDLISGAPLTSVTGVVPTTVAGTGSVVLTAADSAGNNGSNRCSYLIGYGFAPPAGFLSPAPNSKWKTGQTVPIKIQLTGANGGLLSDAEANALVAASGCRLLFSATGAQSLGGSCMKYDAASKQFQFNWKIGTKGTGSETIVVTISYPGTTQTTTRSE